MRAAVVSFYKGTAKVYLHVSPQDVDMVLAAAGGHNFRNRFEGYVNNCNADDNDGLCRCFEDRDHGDDDS